MSEKPTPEQFEFVPNTERLTEQDFALRADEVLGLVEYGQRTGEVRESRIVAEEQFVHDETNPGLRRLAEVLLAAPSAARIDAELNNGGSRSRELRLAAARYNHQLCTMIDGNPGKFDRDELTGWLGRAGRNEAWAEKIMRGVVAEVAGKRELERQREVVAVRFSTPEEDIRGVDLEATLQSGRTLPLDIKASENYLEGGFTFGRDGAKLTIPPEHIDRFDIGREFRGHVIPGAMLRD